MNNNKQNLSVLSLQQQNILKKYPRRQTADGLDVHKLIGKLPKPKKGWVIPGYKYCGAYNPLDIQVDEEGNAKPGHEPKNQLDDICRIHDNLYEKAQNQSDKHTADKDMLQRLRKMKPKGVREKIDRKLVQGVIGAKYHLGLGVKQKQIINELFYKNNNRWQPSQRNKVKY